MPVFAVKVESVLHGRRSEFSIIEAVVLCLLWGSVHARCTVMVQGSYVGFSHSFLLTTFSLVLTVTLISVCLLCQVFLCIHCMFVYYLY